MQTRMPSIIMPETDKTRDITLWLYHSSDLEV